MPAPVGNIFTDFRQFQEVLFDRWIGGIRRKRPILFRLFAQIVGIVKHAAIIPPLALALQHFHCASLQRSETKDDKHRLTVRTNIVQLREPSICDQRICFSDAVDSANLFVDKFFKVFQQFLIAQSELNEQIVLAHHGVNLSIPYQGINVLMLWSEAVAKGYAAPIWMTFKQALELGGHVRKGEHGSLVVYADRFTKTETDAQTGEDVERAIPFMKGYTVFNVEQIDGMPSYYYGKAEPRLDPVQRINRAEQFFAATKADIRHGGAMAYYTRVDP